MEILQSLLPGMQFIEPRVFGDARGFFFESFNARQFAEQTGCNAAFVQDNHSRSAAGVLRGLHYQIRQPQGKLVRVIAGEVFDVAVDLRRSSPAFGQWAGNYLSAANKRHLWIPPGYAHGFLVISESAEFLYKTTNYWAPAHERCVRWDDPQLAIEWPLSSAPQVSAKDAQGVAFADAELFP
jgi:dTDP-4-dehydrorhamnose 3,5-epimerase